MTFFKWFSYRYIYILSETCGRNKNVRSVLQNKFDRIEISIIIVIMYNFRINAYVW